MLNKTQLMLFRPGAFCLGLASVGRAKLEQGIERLEVITVDTLRA